MPRDVDLGAEELETWSVEVPSDFHHPLLRASAESLRHHFRSAAARALAPLRNPHHEPQVDAEARRVAKPAAVLVPVVLHEREPTLLLTRRHHSISYPGHICFPGGSCDPGDRSPVATALREAQEEIALAPEKVQVLGRLGDYVTHSGYRIVPVVSLVQPPLELTPHPGEVEEILEIPLDHVLCSDSYQLRRRTPDRANFYLVYEGAVVAGPTVSLLMGFYEELLKTHDSTGESSRA